MTTSVRRVITLGVGIALLTLGVSAGIYAAQNTSQGAPPFIGGPGGPGRFGAPGRPGGPMGMLPPLPPSLTKFATCAERCR